MATDSRTYSDAIDALNSLQTPFEVVEARRKAGVRPDEASLREMHAYVARIGYSPSDLSRLNVIHVAGTKGKGTTCAFTDSILNHHRLAHSLPSKTGLLISPHLISVRERIRINSRPIEEHLFTRYFWEVWDLLAVTPAALPELALPGTRPVYSRYMTLLALHAFMREGVDCAILETGIGGEYDATNIVERPVATGVTTLGIDHVFALGDTIEKIAWHKGGIAKKGSTAFAMKQSSESAAQVLRERAAEKGQELQVVDVDPRLQGVNVRPNALFQKRNASLAIALAETVLLKLDKSFKRQEDVLPQTFIDGLEKVDWRGRCEVKVGEGVVWHVDGAHTTDSLKTAAKWFVEESATRRGPRALVFNQQGRTEAIDFLDGLYEGSRQANGTVFDHVIFCTNVTYSTGYKKDFVNHQYDAKAIAAMTVQHSFAEKWKTLDSQANITVIPTIQEALDFVQGLTKDNKEGETVQVLITGSLHLVGGALEILEGADAL